MLTRFVRSYHFVHFDNMGSYGDRWLRCKWCWQWGKCLHDDFLNGALPLTDVDAVGDVLCDWCLDLEEPPWWPNNRQRCAMWLGEGKVRPSYFIEKLSPDEEVLPIKTIADFLAVNIP